MQDKMIVKCIVQSEEAIYIYIHTYMTWHDMTWHDITYITYITYITLHYITWHDMTWHDMTYIHYIHYIHYITWHDMTWHDMTLHNITLHFITLHYMTWHDMTWHTYITYITYITLHYITWHDMTWHDMTLHYITLHYITFHYITLHYTTLHTYIHTSIHTSSKIFEKHMGCNKPLSSASGVTPKGKQQGAGLEKWQGYQTEILRIKVKHSLFKRFFKSTLVYFQPPSCEAVSSFTTCTLYSLKPVVSLSPGQVLL